MVRFSHCDVSARTDNSSDQGNRITPSYVAFTDSERLVGEQAKNQGAINPTVSFRF